MRQFIYERSATNIRDWSLAYSFKYDKGEVFFVCYFCYKCEVILKYILKCSLISLIAYIGNVAHLIKLQVHRSIFGLLSFVYT